MMIAENRDQSKENSSPGKMPGTEKGRSAHQEPDPPGTPEADGTDGAPRTLESAQRGWPVDGDLVNNTDVCIYILGEPDPDAPWEVRAVPPGGRDDRGFDADFFKLQEDWYKIHGAARIWVSGKAGQYRRSGFHRPARAAEAEACERMLREFLDKNP